VHGALGISDPRRWRSSCGAPSVVLPAATHDDHSPPDLLIFKYSAAAASDSAPVRDRASPLLAFVFVWVRLEEPDHRPRGLAVCVLDRAAGGGFGGIGPWLAWERGQAGHFAQHDAASRAVMAPHRGPLHRASVGDEVAGP
jgi:hypothetical protein